ncbi:Uncharacterised protein [Mycobacteroides abscessus subsp. abscessus]|nr:Uncharacterised protein [Mycobacteroides abscessus subsp. abscessus]
MMAVQAMMYQKTQISMPQLICGMMYLSQTICSISLGVLCICKLKKKKTGKGASTKKNC